MIQLILLFIAILGLIIPKQLISKKQLENMSPEKLKKTIRGTRIVSVLIILLFIMQVLISLI